MARFSLKFPLKARHVGQPPRAGQAPMNQNDLNRTVRLFRQLVGNTDGRAENGNLCDAVWLATKERETIVLSKTP